MKTGKSGQIYKETDQIWLKYVKMVIKKFSIPSKNTCIIFYVSQKELMSMQKVIGISNVISRYITLVHAHITTVKAVSYIDPTKNATRAKTFFIPDLYNFIWFDPWCNSMMHILVYLRKYLNTAVQSFGISKVF